MSRRGVSLVDVAVPLLAAAVITVAITAQGGPAALPVVLGAAAGLSLFGRSRAPGATLAVSGLLTVILLHLEPDAGVAAVIAPAVALYSLALRRGPRARLVAAVAAIATIVLAEMLHHGGPTLLQMLAHALLVVIPLLVADLHRVRHANLALMKERVAQEERLRVARDLHDVVAHTLTTINVQASTAAELLDRNPSHARSALRTIEDASRDAIDELRAIVGVLRGGEAGEPPLAPAPGLDDVPELVRRTADEDVDVRLKVVGTRPSRVPEPVSLAAYRIIQESLTNARRHAGGAPVEVTVAFAPERMMVAIENAAGAPAPANGRRGGVGIVGMTERAAAIGGTLRAGPLPDGFRVDAELPYSRG